MPRYDFRCADGHVFEQWVARDTRFADCSECGNSAQRELAVPWLPTILGAAAVPKDQRVVHVGEMEEAGQQLDHELAQLSESAGRPLRMPDLTGDALRNAGEVLDGKRAPPAGWEPPSWSKSGKRQTT